MSWAAHNPEAYEGLERSAVAGWLTNQWVAFHGVPAAEVEEEFLPRLAEMLQAEQGEVFSAILAAGADREVDESEYFDGFAQ